MSTPNVQNLKERNAAYAESFTQGHLELPPAKKYLVGKPQSTARSYSLTM